MIKGITLTLNIGPGIPLPVPRDVLDALQSVQVVDGSGETPSGFELKFALDQRSPLNILFLLSGGASIPLVRVQLILTLNGTASTLIDGIMTHHQLSPGSGGQPGILTIQGKDLTVAMDYIDFTGIPYPAMPPVARVALVLAKYAWLGVVPKVIPSIEEPPLPTDRIPFQPGRR